MNILLVRVFGRIETGFLFESKWVDNLPVSTKWLQNMSKIFHIFKNLQNWKNLVCALVNTQALLTGGIMGEETGSRSKFDSIPFHEPLSQNYYLYHLWRFSVAHARRMSQFQALIRSRDSPLNIQTFVLVVFIDATIPMPEFTNGLAENVPCTNKTRKIFLLITYVVFLKITTFLWRILILHPSHTSLFFKL